MANRALDNADGGNLVAEDAIYSAEHRARTYYAAYQDERKKVERLREELASMEGQAAVAGEEWQVELNEAERLRDELDGFSLPTHGGRRRCPLCLAVPSARTGVGLHGHREGCALGDVLAERRAAHEEITRLREQMRTEDDE